MSQGHALHFRAAGLTVELPEVLEPLLREVESLNERIKEYDRRIEQVAKDVYPDVFSGYGRGAGTPDRAIVDGPCSPGEPPAHGPYRRPRHLYSLRSTTWRKSVVE
jgi:hypothetical protein